MKQKKTKKERLALSPEQQHFLIAFGIAVREARKARKLTQEKLGQNIGSNSSYISGVENGKIPLCSEKIGQLMKELGFTFDISITFSDNWKEKDGLL